MAITRKTVLITLGILAFLFLGYAAPILFVSERKPTTFATRSADTPTRMVQPIDAAAVRAKAWGKIAGRLDEADAASLEEMDRALLGIDEYFARCRPGARPFAEAMLSLGGKWRYVKSSLPFADPDGHAKFLRESLEANLFKPDDLRKLLEGTVTGYLTRVKAIENQLLVRIRADLSQGELATADVVPALRQPETFTQEFNRLEKEVLGLVSSDFNFSLSREVALFVGSEVAAHVAMKVGLAAAQRLGISAGILGSGAAVGWATFGVGLVAAIALDFMVDGVLRFSGYDPEGQVVAKVNDMLTSLKKALVNGDPEAHAAYSKLRRMAREDPVAAVRDESKDAADRIDRGGHLGLRHELRRLHEVRAKVRREALRRLILEGETNHGKD